MISVGWEGSFFAHHSLATVNRALCRELSHYPDISLKLYPFEPDEYSPTSADPDSRLITLQRRSSAHTTSLPAIFVRHRWPPDLRRTSPQTRLACILPWEYGALPREWPEQISRSNAEIWVYSSYTHTAFLSAGVAPDTLHRIPLGVDTTLFHPAVPPDAQCTRLIDGRYCFLFVGGAISRKGVDILVNAYLNEFSRDEEVCLFIKDCGPYRSGLAGQIAALCRRSDIPAILYSRSPVLPHELPGWYTAADCLVHPYRAEGFGLPVAEAMACGLPVILSAEGACSDFADETCAFLVHGTWEHFPKAEAGGVVTNGFPRWFVPDTGAVRNRMRYVFTHQEEARSLGRAATRRTATAWTWRHSAEMVYRRCRALSNTI